MRALFLQTEAKYVVQVIFEDGGRRQWYWEGGTVRIQGVREKRKNINADDIEKEAERESKTNKTSTKKKKGRR